MTSEIIPMQEKFEELSKVLNGIKKGEKVLIIGDNDGDGIPGTAIFAKILNNLGLEYKKDFQVMFVEHDFRSLIKNNNELKNNLKNQKYIFLIDMSMDDYSFLTKDTFVCVIDHHKTEANVNLLINPMYHDEMKSKQNCSASALCYCAYRFMFGTNKILEKIAFASSISDWFPIGSLPYLGIDKNDTEYFANGGYIIPTIHSLNTICFLPQDNEFGANWAFEKIFLETDKDLKSIVILPTKFYAKLNKARIDAAKVMERIFSFAEIYGDLVFLRLKEKDRDYKVTINTNLQAIYSNITSVVCFENKKEQGYNISTRSQIIDLLKLGELAKQECKTLTGGGHSVAAGYFIKKQELLKYKKIVIENHNKFKK